MPAFLHLDRLDKSFGRERVLRGVSLTVGKGEVLALLGPSGSGKTTALRTVAGFEIPDAGRIVVDGEDVTRLPPARRNFGMVFQHYALFPHLTVGGNVAFGLAGRGLNRAAVERRVAESLALVDLPGFAERRVGQISGGQQQRVALARALAPEPRVLLLDEPLSNLDPTLRERTRRELRRAIRRVGITTLLVTHEQEEAFHLGDRVAVLYRGILQQVGTPEELYEQPATRFVATFVGRASVLPGRFEGGGVRLDLPGSPVWPGIAAEPLSVGEPVELIVRPESLAFRAPGSPGALAGRVVERRYAGPVTYFQVALEGGSSAAAATPREIEVLAPSGAAAEGNMVAVAPLAPLLDGPIVPRIFKRAAEAIP
ncbi:MAG TPA: ABC transporter ATP-binding protein [Thermoanaerobaculia bacterium]|jgi:ABC-type Fe3+/spermidine/putrescine transport system ATPase subunit|nr:ABC transporter ATP-binding protein [Thermoanaerobaculia bacterium]